jgi:ribosomal protein S18 acetylase RimI-like enzyme
MTEKELEFTLITDPADYPYPLLLLADETVDAINAYIFDSKVYGVNMDGEMIAVFCLYELDETSVELKNIAVAEHLQSVGIGGRIMAYMKQICKPAYTGIIVGTADSGIDQIRFYERHGFHKFDVRKNFFIDHYDRPIFENGVQLRDMVLLKCGL